MNKALVILFMICPCGQAFSAQKPQVAVHFKVETSAYKRHFGGRLADVENQATGLLIRALKQHVQFVDSLVPE